MGLHEYDVQLCPDTNTCRHMQWFYFRVAGMRPGTPYKLNIVNLCKRESLYNHGLRPLTYSEKRVLIHGQAPRSPSTSSFSLVPAHTAGPRWPVVP